MKENNDKVKPATVARKLHALIINVYNKRRSNIFSEPRVMSMRPEQHVCHIFTIIILASLSSSR